MTSSEGGEGKIKYLGGGKKKECLLTYVKVKFCYMYDKISGI
jgi:hypothetical protein